MDRREAIEWLKNIRRTSVFEQVEALDLAIEALGCTDADYISREQAVEVVHKHFIDAINKTPHEIDEDGYDVYTDMKAVNELLKHNKYISKAIKALSPVTPTERTGEWVAIPYEIYGQGEVVTDGYVWQCTNCSDTKERNNPDMNFCPNCGARMRGNTE